MTKNIIEEKNTKTLEQAKKLVTNLVANIVGKVAPGQEDFKYKIAVRDAISSPFEKGKEVETTLLKDVTDLATQEPLLAAFVKENPAKFGLTPVQASNLHNQVTRGIDHNKFNDFLDNTLLLSLSNLKDGVSKPGKGSVNEDTYIQEIREEIGKLRPVKRDIEVTV